LISLRIALSPPPAEMPFIRLEIVLEPVLTLAGAPNLEVIRVRPFRKTLHLMPAVDHLLPSCH
jgi:hypothetical protein